MSRYAQNVKINLPSKFSTPDSEGNGGKTSKLLYNRFRFFFLRILYDLRNIRRLCGGVYTSRTVNKISVRISVVVSWFLFFIVFFFQPFSFRVRGARDWEIIKYTL